MTLLFRTQPYFTNDDLVEGLARILPLPRLFAAAACKWAATLAAGGR